MADNKQKIAEARKRALNRTALYNRVFKSPDGMKVLQDLKEMFVERRSFVPGDPYETHLRVGHVEVLQYIIEIMEANKDGKLEG